MAAVPAHRRVDFLLGLGRGIPGGHGPFSASVQCLHPDGQYPGGFGFSNAVRLDVLP